MIVGTAGHIDHGKTSLVRALTGVDTDRLKEEKERGITIELGFAHWRRPQGVISFIDVPGHERLVHTMLAGATGIDFVVLAVAADDGVMPQTREHVAILDLLGLGRGLVALTKCDLADAGRRAEVGAQVEDLLDGTGLSGCEVLPVSVVTGEGLDVLAVRLDAAAARIAQRSAAGRFRLSVDRVFSLAGAGTVVTGTVVSGSVGVGDAVMVSPPGIEARVRSIHAENQAAERGRAGQRCALALVGPKVDKDSVPRGSVVLDPGLHAPTRRIDARLSVLASERKPLSQWMPVRLHHGAAEVPARLVLLRAGKDGAADLPPGETDLVQLVLDAPLAAAAGDRFVLRDTAATRTIGGGSLVDLRAPERKRAVPERRAELEALARAEPLAALEAVLGGARGWTDLAAFFRDRALVDRTAEAEEALDLVVLRAGEIAAGMRRVTWDAYGEALVALLRAFHADKPDLPGLGQERVRLGLRPRFSAPVFAAALRRLQADGVVVLDRAWLRLPGHEVRLLPQDEAAWSRVLPLLGGATRFRPPRVRDIAKQLFLDEASLRRLFKLAARRGDVDEVAPDHYFLAASVVEMADVARALAAAGDGGEFPVIAFRDRLDNGRKVAIQILEYFDRQGLTMRRGDIRRINPHRSTLFSTPPAESAPAAPHRSADGGVPLPVERPDFKSGKSRETALGRFDSYLLRQPVQEGQR